MINNYLTINSENACVLCSEVIYNPICHECLAKQVKTWLSSYPDVKKKITPKINSFVKEVEDLVIDSVVCIACKKKKAALCPYCFCDRIFRILKKEKIDPLIIGDFLSTFNFDFDHTGYIKEAEEDGLY